MSDTDTILIPNQEIQPGIYVANTITSKQNTFVRLLNTTDYSRHITRLCKKNVPFECSSECQKSFQYLKDKLIEPTLLQYPDFLKEFCIILDASKQACGALLFQNHNGLQFPIAYHLHLQKLKAIKALQNRN